MSIVVNSRKSFVFALMKCSNAAFGEQNKMRIKKRQYRQLATESTSSVAQGDNKCQWGYINLNK